MAEKPDNAPERYKLADNLNFQLRRLIEVISWRIRLPKWYLCRAACRLSGGHRLVDIFPDGLPCHKICARCGSGGTLYRDLPLRPPLRHWRSFE